MSVSCLFSCNFYLVIGQWSKLSHGFWYQSLWYKLCLTKIYAVAEWGKQWPSCVLDIKRVYFISFTAKKLESSRYICSSKTQTSPSNFVFWEDGTGIPFFFTSLLCSFECLRHIHVYYKLYHGCYIESMLLNCVPFLPRDFALLHPLQILLLMH